MLRSGLLFGQNKHAKVVSLGNVTAFQSSSINRENKFNP